MYDDIKNRIKRLQGTNDTKNSVLFLHYPERLPDRLQTNCRVVFCSIAPVDRNDTDETLKEKDRIFSEWGSMIAAECDRRSIAATWIGGTYQNRGRQHV